MIAFELISPVSITTAISQTVDATPSPPTASHIWVALLLGSVMGAFGQGCRAIVGLTTLAVYNVDKEPSERDNFNLARLLFSFLVGALAGFVTGLIAWQGNSIGSINIASFEEMFKFAIAGYIGSDIIEAFTARFFPQTSSHGPKANSPKQDAGGQKAANLETDDVPRENSAAVSSFSMAAPDTNSHRTIPVIGSKDWTKSELMSDMVEALKYGEEIRSAAKKYSLEPSLICAIGSRESNWGRSLKPKGPTGTGDWARRNGKLPPDGKGWGRGLMQADYAASDFAKDFDKWSKPEQNIDFGCNELYRDLQLFEAKYPQLSEEDRLKAGIASYNTGPGNVERSILRQRDVDYTTAGHDYSADVLTRMAFFKGSGFDEKIDSP